MVDREHLFPLRSLSALSFAEQMHQMQTEMKSLSNQKQTELNDKVRLRSRPSPSKCFLLRAFKEKKIKDLQMESEALHERERSLPLFFTGRSMFLSSLCRRIEVLNDQIQKMESLFTSIDLLHLFLLVFVDAKKVSPIRNRSRGKISLNPFWPRKENWNSNENSTFVSLLPTLTPSRFRLLSFSFFK